MEKFILDKATILQNGINFENLAFEYCSDRILDDYEENGGKPFTGLTYELFEDDKIAYYCFYVDGFPDGDYVRFYPNGAVQGVSKMKKGQSTKSIEWYQDGTIKEAGMYQCGICTSCKKWDEHGTLVYEKVGPTDDERLLIEKLSRLQL